MKHLVATICGVLFFSFGFAQSSDAETVTKESNIELTVKNTGVFGNAFKGSFQNGTGTASCEYPKGSGVEHLFESGFWIGAKINGNIEAVSTCSQDNSKGYSPGASGFEFYAEENTGLSERSSLIYSPKYNPNAVSHQDIVMDYYDKFIKVPGTEIAISNHSNPLNVKVHQETYNWNFAFANFFVVHNLTITNESQNELVDPYVGIWANSVVRNINITPAGSGGSSFYDKGGNGFIDSLNLAYCFDAGGDVGFTNSYFSHMFLGGEDSKGFRHPSIDSTFTTNYSAWQFNNSTGAVFILPQTDQEKYARMTLGLNKDICWSPENDPNQQCNIAPNYYREQLRSAGNRSDLISVGPFDTLSPGESINVTFAFVLAKKFEDGYPNSEDNPDQQQTLVQNAEWAQTAYNGEDKNFNGELDPGEDRNGDGELTRFVLPSPPDLPNTKIVAEDKTIKIYWTDNAESSIDPISQKMDFEGYKIYLSKVGFDANDQDMLENLVLLKQFDLEGNGLFYDTGLDTLRLESPITFEGDTNVYRYAYEIKNVLNGWQYGVSITSFDRGDEENNVASLESSILGNLERVFPGKAANSDESEAPFAYPNPYYLSSAFEGSSERSENRRMVFANLPERCVIRIFNPSGDLVDEFEHNQDYAGDDILWYETYSDPENTTFSGGEHSWDLLSSNQQIIARGLYIFTVENMDTGKLTKGQFLIIK